MTINETTLLSSHYFKKKIINIGKKKKECSFISSPGIKGPSELFSSLGVRRLSSSSLLKLLGQIKKKKNLA